MTCRRSLRAAAIALFATGVVAASPSSAWGQDLSCERGDLEVRGLDFRGNRAIDDDELALRVVVTPSSRARRVFRLPFGQKRCLNRPELGNDIDRVRGFYRQRGYYGAQVDTAVQQLSRDAVRVIFNIEEGRPTLLTRYEVTGLDSIATRDEILRRLRLKVGEPFDYPRFIADIDTIVNRLRDAGYYRADHVQGYDVDTAAAQASAFITVLPGRRARFGRHEWFIDPVPGRDVEVDTAVVRRIMGIRERQLYSDRAIVEAQRALFQLAAYRHIEVAPLPDSAQPPGDSIVRLAVRLTEDFMKQVDAEFGWATLDCGRVRAQYTDRNFLGTARRLELSGQASKIGYGHPLATETTRRLCSFNGSTPIDEDIFSDTLHYFAGAAVRQPRLLGTLWVPTMSWYSERRGEYKAYLRTTSIGSDLSATRDLGDRMPLRVGYTFEYGQTQAEAPALCALFNRCDVDSRRQIQERLPLGVASASLLRSRTDNPVSPTRGILIRTEVRSSASGLLGTSPDLFFNKATGDVAWYTPVGQNVLTMRLRGGLVLGQRLTLDDETGFIPPQERLYAGGPTSVRGFQQNELGALVYIADRAVVNERMVVERIIVSPPTATDTIFNFQHRAPDRAPDRSVPLGGNSLVVANLEYRVRDPFLFPDLLQYAFFVDGGDVWTRGPGRGPQLKWTPGFGIRALTPVGPVQVNIGYNRYARENGPIFFNPDVFTLACATPGNGLTYRKGASTEDRLEPMDEETPCPPSYRPPPRTRWLQRLTFTFSIGPDF